MKICADCLMAAVNNDFTGMDWATERDVRRGLERVGPMYCIDNLETGDNDAGFSWSPCDCCLSPLGGMRYLMGVIE